MASTEALLRESEPVPVRRTALQHWMPALGITVLLLVGGYLRLHGLGTKSITHPEMYVPGIHMPVGISQPRERLTLISILTGTFTSDTHPPGFYIMMWIWTKCFGTSIWSIRLPAALLGIACIPLLLWLGFLVGQRHAAWIAAALLAVNAHHVFWSQTARMYSLACFLGLLATILLVLIARRPRPTTSLDAAYVIVLLLGVTSHVFFWLILGTHLVWALLNGWGRARSLPRLVNLQILAFILGSPLLAFAAYQSGTTVAPLSSDVLVYAREFVQFGFLFPLLEFSTGLFLPSGPFPAVADPHLSVVRWAFILVSAVLLFLGIIGSRRAAIEDFPDGPRRYAKRWIFAASFSVLVILAFVAVAVSVLQSPAQTLKLTKIMCAVPLLLAGGGVLMASLWKKYSHPCACWAILGSLSGLIAVMTIVPFVVLGIASRLKPVFNARGMTLLVPYLLLTLAAGIVWLIRRSRWLGGICVIVLVLVHADALSAYEPLTTDPVDYKALVAALSVQRAPDDLVFIRPGLWSTPFLYYFTPNQYHLIASDYVRVALDHPNSRVWLILREHEPVPPDMRPAVANRREISCVTAWHARAFLYSSRLPIVSVK
jgi:4-amino-4-deoxy-L-arabinose transferase-like glycosyltransferase